MSITIPGSYTTIDPAEILPGEDIDQADLVSLLGNHNIAYAATNQLYVNDVFRAGNAEGAYTDIDSSTNYMFEWRCLADPDVAAVRVRVLMRTDNASNAARAELTVDDGGTSATSATMSTTSTTYAWVTTTVTRGAFNTGFTTFTLAFWVATGATGYIKAVHISAEPSASLAASGGGYSSGFVPLDNSQCADGSPYPHTLIEDFTGNSLALRRYRNWTRASTAEAVDSNTYGTYRYFRSTSTDWTTVGRFAFRMPSDLAQVRFAFDGIDGNAGSSSLARVVVRPANSGGGYPTDNEIDTSALIDALPDKNGASTSKTALTWGATLTWLSDAETAADMTFTRIPGITHYEALMQVQSDGTYHPEIKSFCAWAVVPTINGHVVKPSWLQTTYSHHVFDAIGKVDIFNGGLHGRWHVLFNSGAIDTSDMNSDSEYSGATLKGAQAIVLPSLGCSRFQLIVLAAGVGQVIATETTDSSTCRVFVNLPHKSGDSSPRNVDGHWASWWRSSEVMETAYDGAHRVIQLTTYNSDAANEHKRMHVFAAILVEVP